MNVCDSGHDEIVYLESGMFSSRGCPLCEAKEEIADLEKTITDLEKTNADLEAAAGE